MRRECNKCKVTFDERDLEVSHDIPKYIGVDDTMGRRFLCEKCHKEYEDTVFKIALMSIIKNHFPEDWKRTGRLAIYKFKETFFK